MLYLLMNKDKVVATYSGVEEYGEFLLEPVEVLDEYLPYGFTDVNDWVDDRQVAKRRSSIKSLMVELAINDRKRFIDTVRCVSLTDTFWMKREDSDITWRDVSLYTNSFFDVVARIAFDGVGMYGRQFSAPVPSLGRRGRSTSAGCARRMGLIS